ncbi:MFS transporter [Legionella parisiensis]|uniref:Lysosomal dipeptide transporter MFSD1 n=1 Tax=Legionella parisiensis TaxID=45071 RepID=A0A1E5JM07_9GAMM|nr:MFS transporter [Legionella parisiensis]KTD41345.1 major facilitator family transporter (MFS) [Legionella parisiensis]OEH45510.1 putative glucarate transporter [Legionella parisiensis]STX76352.1 major facilitator family transporter (MFS) [Legionella parisiensis]
MGNTLDAEASQQQKITHRALFIISLCAAFLFYKYILQNFPSVMPQQLMDAFNLKGLGLGVLSGVYFWTYLIVPLFVGIVLDRYGTRWVTTAAIFCCAFGIYIFSQAQELNIAIWGRALTGVGVSFASIAYFKLAAVWFPQKYYALLTSLLVTAAMVGAIFGQMPLAWLVSQVGWRSSLLYMAWMGIILAFLFFSIVKDKPSSSIECTESKANPEPKNPHLWQDILLIVKSKQNWLLTGYSGLAFSPIVIFCGLWGNPFLQKAYHLDKLVSPSLISLVFVGLAIACPVFALLINRIQNRCAFIFYSTLISAISISLVIYAHPMPIWLLSVLLFLFGFSLGAFPIVFVIGKESNPLYLAGTVTSLINASDAFLDAITEPAIGKLLDIFSNAGTSHDFSLSGYHIGLAILPLYQIIGAFLMRWVKDEHRIVH